MFWVGWEEQKKHIHCVLTLFCYGVVLGFFLVDFCLCFSFILHEWIVCFLKERVNFVNLKITKDKTSLIHSMLFAR